MILERDSQGVNRLRSSHPPELPRGAFPSLGVLVFGKLLHLLLLFLRAVPGRIGSGGMDRARERDSQSEDEDAIVHFPSWLLRVAEGRSEGTRRSRVREV